VRVFEYGVVGKPKAEGVCRGIQGGSKRAKLLVSMEEVTIHDGDHRHDEWKTCMAVGSRQSALWLLACLALISSIRLALYSGLRGI